MWAVIFSVSTVALASCAAAVAWFAARRAVRVAGSLRARMHSCESRIESLTDSHAEWSKLTLDLANSVKMQKVRRMTGLQSSADQVTGLPDPHKDPEAWRKAMNLRIAEGKLRANK